MKYTPENPLKFTVLGIPQPKQSARFRSIATKHKTFIQSYQKQEVVDKQNNFGFDIKSQLPKDFVPFNGPIGVKTLFVFPPLKGWSKSKLKDLENGVKIYKDTKPDLVDNLKKLCFDAMSGIVYVDDARVCKEEGEKIFGFTPRIELEFYEL